jgi:biotin/methionine sulfoxide reductase
MPTLTAMHWGVYEVEPQGTGRPPRLRPFWEDPDPSPIGLYALDERLERLRVRRPAVRRGFLEKGPITRETGPTTARGREPFVEVPWDEALDLVAREIARVKARHSNRSIFGGSYGWASAGRFHHAQSQIHRFLNACGGYVAHKDSYSLGAARVLTPHILGEPMEVVGQMSTSWDVLEAHCQLFVAFGGVPAKNAQVTTGGSSEHRIPGALRRMAAAGVRFVDISPVSDDIATGAEVEWLAIRPNTDTALMLALAHTLWVEGLADKAFLARCTVGLDEVLPYLLGHTDGVVKDAAWAAAITDIPAARIVALAREMAAARTMISVAWSLQRAHHGEQPFWMGVVLAAMLGQIGLPGGGFALGYGPTNLMGSPHVRFPGPTLSQGTNGVADFIPVARIADLLLRPGETFRYNGATHTYADIRLVYWAGGNPFHHHQDLNRLLTAWQQPEVVIVNEQYWTPTARLADIVLPATISLERDDIGYAPRERHMIAMKQAVAPVGEARDDYAIFEGIAERLGADVRASFTEGRSVSAWLRHMYDDGRAKAAAAGVGLPTFDDFWRAGLAVTDRRNEPIVMLADFRADPERHPLKTPSGRLELASARIAGFALPDCGAHPAWREPAEWLGGATAERYPLHMLSDQPATRLHSQLDASPHSQAAKVAGREPITLNPLDAAARGITGGDIVRVFNDRGQCLAGAIVSEVVRPGVVRLSTGAWYDPVAFEPGALEKAGNPNVLTLDIGASELSQGCIAQTCLVDVERYEGEAPAVTAYDPPAFVAS